MTDQLVALNHIEKRQTRRCAVADDAADERGIAPAIADTRSWRATAVASRVCWKLPMKAMQFCSLAAVVTVARWLTSRSKEGCLRHKRMNSPNWKGSRI